MSAVQLIALGLALLAILAGLILALWKYYRVSLIAGMSDRSLLRHGLWDNDSGDPMNDYAEEYERRHGLKFD